MELTISIVSYNTKDLTLQCLKSIYQNTHDVDYEIYVVDNASTDGSDEAIEKKFPEVKLIRNEENLGFAKANNQVINTNSSRYVLFLNSDTIIKEKAIDILLDFLNKHPDVGAVGPGLVSPSGEIRHGCCRRQDLWEVFLRTFFFIDRRWYPQERGKVSFPIDNLFATCFLVRRSVLNLVGGFDESFFMYSEDIDLSFRIWHAKYKIYLLPTAKVVHIEKASFYKNPELSFYKTDRAYCRVYRKYHHIIPSLIFFLSIVVFRRINFSIYRRIIFFRDIFWKRTGIRISRKEIVRHQPTKRGGKV